MKKIGKWLFSLVLLVSLLPQNVQATEEKKSADLKLWEAVVPLTTTVSFMNTGAHPDDERSHFLAFLSRGLGVETSFLLSTRGQGGQNEIGSELGNGLGIIRTNELQASSNVLGIDTFFLNEGFEDQVKDFGFSKSSEETLQKWGETKTYQRLIRHIRTFKPDIVMPSFRDVDSQHGHHRAMTLLTEQAFRDAADPTVFPEQIDEGLTPWQVKKMYLPAETEEQTTTSIEIGIFDPFYNMTYPQLGEKARYLHESQGMGRDLEEGSEIVQLQLVHSTVGEIPKLEETIFDGLSYDFEEYGTGLEKSDRAYKEKLTSLQEQLEQIKADFPNEQMMMKHSLKALKNVDHLQRKIEKDSKLDEALQQTLLHKLQIKEQQLQHVVFTASGLDVEMTVEDPALTDGDTTNVNVILKHNGDQTLHNLSSTLEVPEGWKKTWESPVLKLEPGESVGFTYEVTANGEELYHAYNPHLLQATVQIGTKERNVTKQVTPNQRVALLPDAGLTVDPENLVINTKNVKNAVQVDVEIKKFVEDAMHGTVSLQVPTDWSTESKPIFFSKNEWKKTVTFTVTPPDVVDDGTFTFKPVISIGGKTITSSVQTIDYAHIGKDYYISEAKVDGVAFPLAYPEDLKVGYVDSGFDKVAEQLMDLGMDITKLDKQALETGDLSQYDTIVTGIRAYLSREDLLENNERLLEFVNNGGHLVVQYNKPWDNWNKEETAPYLLEIGQPSIEWRVTDEAAPIEVLKPASPLFTYPNNIGDSVWEGWVQERGLYFPMDWSDEFETFVRVADPGEEAFEGGILMAEYGEGTYLYTNLVWYRQIQNQVPGGYRTFTNMLSYPFHK